MSDTNGEGNTTETGERTTTTHHEDGEGNTSGTGERTTTTQQEDGEGNTTRTGKRATTIQDKATGTGERTTMAQDEASRTGERITTTQHEDGEGHTTGMGERMGERATTAQDEAIGTGERTTTTHREVDYERKCKELETVVEKQSTIINGLQTSAIQVANFYSVSQAVVFSALPSYSSSLKCHDVWFPWAISLLPGFLNLYALHLIGNEYIEAYMLRDVNDRLHIELTRRRRMISAQGRLTAPEQHIEADPVLRRRITYYFYACMIAFALFAIVIALGSVRMLCGKHPNINNVVKD